MNKTQERRTAYNSVIQDLYAKRLQLNQAIEALEALIESEQPASAEHPAIGQARRVDEIAVRSIAGEATGTLIDAIKSVLGRSGRPLGNAEIFTQLKVAGVQFRSANPQLSVSQVLSRNSRLFGEPVRVGRGRWALR